MLVALQPSRWTRSQWSRELSRRDSGIFLWTARGVAAGLTLSILAEPLQIKLGEHDALRGVRLHHERSVWVKGYGSAVTLWCRIVGHRHRDQVLERSRPKLSDADIPDARFAIVEVACVGGQNELSPIQHEHPRRFGEFPIEADHYPYPDGPRRVSSAQTGNSSPAAHALSGGFHGPRWTFE